MRAEAKGFLTTCTCHLPKQGQTRNFFPNFQSPFFPFLFHVTCQYYVIILHCTLLGFYIRSQNDMLFVSYIIHVLYIFLEGSIRNG